LENTLSKSGGTGLVIVNFAVAVYAIILLNDEFVHFIHFCLSEIARSSV